MLSGPYRTLVTAHNYQKLARRIGKLQHCCRSLITLAIETSCDDTAVAILEKQGTKALLHFNQRITANQGSLTGIHPIVALESHEAQLALLLQKALRHLPRTRNKSKLETEPRKLQMETEVASTYCRLPDFISVTRGPGLKANLNAGLNVAKGLAVAWQIPLLGVHHMQAHALTPRLSAALKKGSQDNSIGQLSPQFPFLSLLVSGGHTLLACSTSLTEHTILLDTADYAIGDCLDKIARAILPRRVLDNASSTSYGPLLEKFAFPNGASDYNYHAPKTVKEEMRLSNQATAFGWTMPLPFLDSRGGMKRSELRFSFTGIESHALRIAKYGWNMSTGGCHKTPRSEAMSHQEIQCLAQESMRVCFQHIASRIALVLEHEHSQTGDYPKQLVVSGGVASNSYLRHLLPIYLAARGFPMEPLIAPPIDLCTDNAAMVAWTGCEMFEAGNTSDLSIRGLSKWSLENLINPQVEMEAKGWIENHDKTTAALTNTVLP